VNLSEFRDQMATYRRTADQEGRTLKDSYLALERLHSLYRSLDTDERTMANQVLEEWVLSDDENVRFDALALIDDFKISAATSALQALADRLALSSKRGASYELQKVYRILRSMGAR
jgi:cysteinyl-tRNA synthetase